MAGTNNSEFDSLIFAERLSDLRNSKGLTQNELSNKTGFTLAYIKKWESCERPIKAPHLFVLSKFFGVSTDYLIGASEIKSPNVKIIGASELTGLSEDCINILSKPKNFSDEQRQILSDFIVHEQFVDLIDSISEYIYIENHRDLLKINNGEKITEIPQKYIDTGDPRSDPQYILFKAQESFIEIVKSLSESRGEKS